MEKDAFNFPPFTGRKRVAVICSLTYSLVNFRLELLKSMVANGHEVYALGPENDSATLGVLDAAGIRFVRLPMARTSLNPFRDFLTLVFLWRWFLKMKPDLVLPYTMKPIVYAGIAARLAFVRKRFFLVTGLGYIFREEEGGGLRASLIKFVAVRLYRLAMGGADAVFVYNEADETDIGKHALAASATPLVRVPGSGVDLELYRGSAPLLDPPTFILIARMLRDKGVFDFVAAARLLRQSYPHVRFCLLGPLDPSPNAIGRSDIDAWGREGIVDYLGETRDVKPYLAACSAYVLPSYYREGIPRTILEAMATGRAIVTADTPGCRETVVDGENGFLVPAKDPVRLAEAMERLIRDPSLFTAMGEASRRMARERFEVHAVNRLLLRAMGLDGASGG